MAAPALLYRGTLTTANTTLYTTPTNGAVLTNLVLTNVLGAAANATIYINGVPLTYALSIPVNGTVTLDMKQVAPSGQNVTGLASAAGAVAAHLSGVTL